MKRVVFTYDFASNYILHVFAVARISYDSEYSNRYRQTMQTRDLEYLESHRYLLEFGPGRAGPLVPFSFFLPAYLGLRGMDDFERYYRLLISSMEVNDFSDFLREYHLDWEDPFLSANYKYLMLEMSSREWEETIKPLIPRLKEVGKIFTRNIEGYSEVWEYVKPILRGRAEVLGRRLDKQDIIGEWEKATGRVFLRDRYYILLCYANKNGPNAISLSYDKNIFYYGSPDEYIRDLVSHEVGTHILFTLLNSEGLDQEGYAAFECLAAFLNLKILGKRSLSYSLSRFNCRKFLPIYEKYYGRVGPKRLIELALNQ